MKGKGKGKSKGRGKGKGKGKGSSARTQAAPRRDQEDVEHFIGKNKRLYLIIGWQLFIVKN